MTKDVKQELSLDVANRLQHKLLKLREPWRSSRLIERVERLVLVDHSCACQKLFNTAIWDIKDKLGDWGEDFVYKIAHSPRNTNRGIENTIEGLSTTELLNLSYKSKLLKFEQWEMMTECYQIRCKLEHEDKRFEVNSLETEKFFNVCINEVLNVEKIEIETIDQFEYLYDTSRIAVPSKVLIDSFAEWSKSKRERTIMFLLDLATDSSISVSVRHNSRTSLMFLRTHLTDDLKKAIANRYSDPNIQHIDSDLLETLRCIDVLRLIDRSSNSKFFESVYVAMNEVGEEWYKGIKQVEVLQSFTELGSLDECPNRHKVNIFNWLALTFIGQDSGNTAYVSDRNVYFDKDASSFIQRLIREAHFISDRMINDLLLDEIISVRIENSFIAARFERFIELAVANRKKE